MAGADGDVIGGSLEGADLLIYGVLFVGALVVCVVLALAVRRAWARWAPPPADPPEPSAEDRVRLAVHRLETAGVDLPAVLGEWSPTRLAPPGRTSVRAPGDRSPARAG